MLIASEAFWLCLSILPEERVSSSLAHTYTNKIILQNAAGSSSSPPLTQALPYGPCGPQRMTVPSAWEWPYSQSLCWDDLPSQIITTINQLNAEATTTPQLHNQGSHACVCLITPRVVHNTQARLHSRKIL